MLRSEVSVTGRGDDRLRCSLHTERRKFNYCIYTADVWKERSGGLQNKVGFTNIQSNVWIRKRKTSAEIVTIVEVKI